MDEWFYFFLQKKSSLAAGLEELKKAGVCEISELYDCEQNHRFFCGKIKRDLLPSSWTHIETCTPLSSSIDWVAQWEAFCPYFQNGLGKIPLKDFDCKTEKNLILVPGPGFGDLSHPTTRLMMRQVGKYAPHKVVIDLGCGCGILGLSSLLCFAKKAYCLDIDPEAIAHTRENGAINSLEEKLFVGSHLPSEMATPPDLLLLNMTLGEQRQAIYAFLADAKDMTPPIWITSGIMKRQKKEYLSFMKERGLVLEKVEEEEGWILCVFKKEK
jgi:ribosomal protein L11 methyltransferase